MSDDKAPERIWLGFDYREEVGDLVIDTWDYTEIPGGIGYIRADTAESELRAAQAEIAELKRKMRAMVEDENDRAPGGGPP